MRANDSGSDERGQRRGRQGDALGAFGRVLIDAGKFADAARELAICKARTGEGASDVSDTPFVRRLSRLDYYIGRAQEGLGDKAAAHAAYKTFVENYASPDPDPLVADARKRLAAK